jgi:hypothetical protein
MSPRDREKQERELAERRQGDDHHDLNNPVDNPDPTEWPDPYEKRPDPRDPAAVDAPAAPAEHEPAEEAPQDPSTSDPPPPRGHDQARTDPPPR